MSQHEINLSSQKSAYQIRIQSVEEFESSIFKDVFENAKKNVLDIINNQPDSGSTKKYDAYNNVIAFTGERGKGKSSSMISFLSALSSYTSSNNSYFNEFKNLEKNPHFVVLDVIDPSLFRGKETLFEIILANMFSQFKQSLDDKNKYSHINDEQRRELVKHFQTVFSNLKYTTGNNKDTLYQEEALEALMKLATGSNLRESFNKLVQSFLDIHGVKDKQNFLVIAIDDFDLKFDGVYEMLEDIRQFLITQKVILLIACKMEQLREAVYAKIYEDFASKHKGIDLDKVISISELQGKAEKYIAKLIPVTRRSNLPDLEITINKNHTGAFQKIPLLLFEQLGVYINEDLNRDFYPDTLREYHIFENILTSENPHDKKLLLFENYIIDKINNIGLHRNLSEIFINSKSDNYLTNFCQILFKLDNEFNRTSQLFKKSDLTPPFYPKIIQLYLHLEDTIPVFENNHRKLLSFYRILFNIQHLKFSKGLDDDFFKVYDNKANGKLLRESQDYGVRDYIEIAFDRRNADDQLFNSDFISRFNHFILYYGESKKEFRGGIQESTYLHFTITPINGIFVRNPKLRPHFNIDLTLTYFDCLKNADYKGKLPENKYFDQILVLTKTSIDDFIDRISKDENCKNSRYLQRLTSLITNSIFYSDYLENYEEFVNSNEHILRRIFNKSSIPLQPFDDRKIFLLKEFKEKLSGKKVYAKTIEDKYFNLIRNYPDLLEEGLVYSSGEEIKDQKHIIYELVENIIQDLENRRSNDFNS